MGRADRSVRADGAATRARILEAAGALFAESGFAETTGKAIARKAQVDVASINYHFGSRSGLYQAVLSEAHRRIMDVADMRQLATSRVPASEKLRLFIDRIVQRARSDRNGWHLPVMAAELLAPTSHLQVLFESDISAKVSVVTGILGEITGIPVDAPDMRLCLLSVAAPCMLLVIGQRGIPWVPLANPQMPHEVIVRHLYRFAMAGLEACGRDYLAGHPRRGL